MRVSRFLSWCLALAICLFPAHGAQASGPYTWHVSPAGENPSQCPGHPSSTPLLTIRFALKCAKDGDTIKAAAGRYTSAFNITKDVTITGAGSRTVIDGGNAATVVTIAATSTATIKNAKVKHGLVGIGVLGGLSLSHVSVDHNAGDGILIDTDQLVTLDVFESHDNGGAGLFIKRASGPEISVLGERTDMDVSSTIIHHNAGNGITIGRPSDQSNINVLVQDVDVRYNDKDGVVVEDQGDATYLPRLNGLNVWYNGGHGAYIKTPIPPAIGYSIPDLYDDPLLPDEWTNNGTTCCNYPNSTPFGTARFNGNRFHSNLLNQVVFDGLIPGDPGPVGYGNTFYIDSSSRGCNIGPNVAYSYRDRGAIGPNTVAIDALNHARVFVNHFGFTGGQAHTNDYRYDDFSLIKVVNPCSSPPVSP